MLQSYERYMKQAIVDRNENIASAALVSSLNQANNGGLDVVKRWSNEAIEAMVSPSNMVQYHALGFLHFIRKTDKLAISKMVNKLTRNGSLKSSYALCYLIRIAASLIKDGDNQEALISYIASCLRQPNEMVVFEAANALVNLSRNDNKLNLAIASLQHFCTSQVTAARFAAVRTLNQISINFPESVAACNDDLESLIHDSNRSIATLAITTLLKTGAESSIERLMGQIATFVNDISDEFKVMVVTAIESLCLKFPNKYCILMNFLSTMLREEGGFNYKKCITETFVKLITEFPDAKEKGLAHLSEFIEDCEHTILAVKVLHFLGIEGPKAKKPSKYIRFIYNRVILENAAEIRAAAVSTLAKFGSACEALKSNILVLLKRCQLDTDDEVRDRATYYLNVLEQSLPYKYISHQLDVDLHSLSVHLHNYTLSDCTLPFQIDAVPKKLQQKPATKTYNKTEKEIVINATKSHHDIPREFNEMLGSLFKSIGSVQLSETETEISVTCTKHVFLGHLVLQFDCTNTLPDQILENVEVAFIETLPYELIKTTSCLKIRHEETGCLFAIFSLPLEVSDWICCFTPTLKFIVKDCDPSTGEEVSIDGFNDEFCLEMLEILASDFVMPRIVNNFQNAWQSVEDELEETFAFKQIESLEKAVRLLIKHLGMNACEKSEFVTGGKISHVLLLSGMFFCF